MAAVHVSCMATCSDKALVARPQADLSSALSFSRSVSSSPLALTRSSQLSHSQSLLLVRAEKGTQLFRWPGSEKKGTIILKGGKKAGTQKESASRGGTRVITTTTKPEEVAVAKAGLLDGLLKPFANLFAGRISDPKTVFVAGPTGVTGTRVVLELLAAGFSVRAGVDEASSAKSLTELATQFRQLISAEDAKRLSFVQCDSADPEFTAKSIGTAGRVVVTLGAEENGPKTNVSPSQAQGLLQAALQAKCPYFILVTEIADPSGGSGGGLLGAVFGFFSNLGKKGATYSELFKELIDSKIKFTVVRTGKSSGVPDSVANSTNIVIGQEGKFSAGSISRLQVAQVVSEVLSNIQVAENKVFDVVASPGAEAVPIPEMIQAIPTDGRRAAKEAVKAKQETEAKEKEFKVAAEAEARAVAAEARAAAESLTALEAEAKRLEAEEARAAAAEAKAQARAQAASDTVADLSKSLREASSAAKGAMTKSVIPSFASLVPDIPGPTPSSVAAAAQAAAAAAAASVSKQFGGTESGSEGTVKQRRPLRQRVEKAKPAAAAPAPPAPKKAPTPSQEVKKEKVLGFFEQETIYVDDD